MAGQPGFFDGDERLEWLSAAGAPLERLSKVVDFELFRGELERALKRSDRTKGGRPPYDAVLMFKVLVLQTLSRCRTTGPSTNCVIGCRSCGWLGWHCTSRYRMRRQSGSIASNCYARAV